MTVAMGQAVEILSDFDVLLIHNSTMVLPDSPVHARNFRRSDNSPRASIAIGKHGAQDVRDAIKIRRPLLRSRLRCGLIASDGLSIINFRTRLFGPKRLVLQVQIHCAIRSRQRTIAAGDCAVMS